MKNDRKTPAVNLWAPWHTGGHCCPSFLSLLGAHWSLGGLDQRNAGDCCVFPVR